MLSSRLLPSKSLFALAMLVGMATHAVASEAEAPDTAELYEYLFPEAKGRVSRPVALSEAAYAAPEASRPLSGFASQNRRTGWTAEQAAAMKEAFKRKPPAASPPPAALPLPAESGLFDPQQQLGDEPYAALIQKYAKEQNVSPTLISQIIHQESRGNPDAVSPKGAQGLMQLMPDLSNKFNIDPFDPESNIKVGTRYFAEMLKKYGQVDLALAAYNAGPGAVDKYDGIPPFNETQNYVSTILAGVTKLEASNQ